MNKTIGIIGVGSVSARIAEEAKKMSVPVLKLDSLKDKGALNRLAQQSDVITYEPALGKSAMLQELEENGAKIVPSSETLNTIQDKYLLKERLKKFGIPVPEFVEINSTESLAHFISEFRFPSVLKRKTDLAGGKGEMILQTMEDLSELLSTHVLDGDLKEKKYMLEKRAPFIEEISIRIARNFSGETAVHLLNETVFNSAGMAHAKRIAVSAIDSVNGVGVFGIEMFVCSDESVLVKDIVFCPPDSDFGLYVRSLLDLPLAEPDTMILEMKPL